LSKHFSTSAEVVQILETVWFAGDVKAYQPAGYLVYKQTSKGSFSSSLSLSLWLCTSTTGWWQIQVGILGTPIAVIHFGGVSFTLVV